jgi:hypothetical protein
MDAIIGPNLVGPATFRSPAVQSRCFDLCDFHGELFAFRFVYDSPQFIGIEERENFPHPRLLPELSESAERLVKLATFGDNQFAVLFEFARP